MTQMILQIRQLYATRDSPLSPPRPHDPHHLRSVGLRGAPREQVKQTVLAVGTTMLAKFIGSTVAPLQSVVKIREGAAVSRHRARNPLDVVDQRLTGASDLTYVNSTRYTTGNVRVHLRSFSSASGCRAIFCT